MARRSRLITARRCASISAALASSFFKRVISAIRSRRSVRRASITSRSCSAASFRTGCHPVNRRSATGFRNIGGADDMDGLAASSAAFFSAAALAASFALAASSSMRALSA